MTNWRDEFATPAERLASLKGKTTLSDMTFIVGSSETKIPGHRFVLSLVSESFESCDREIRIADFEVEIFMEFLGYVYSGEVTLSDTTALEMLKLANRYSVDFLKKDCVDFLRRNINVTNVLQCLDLGIELDVKDLKFESLDVISDFTQAVVQQDAFLEISLDTLRHILELDIIICTEYEIFQAAMRWADAECHRQGLEGNCENYNKILGDTMDLIRFSAIEPEFAEEFRNMTDQTKEKAKYRSLSSSLPTFFDYGHVKLTIRSPLDRIHLSPEAVRECSLELTSNQLISVFGFGVIVETGAELTGWAEMSYKYDGDWVELKKNVNVSVGCRWKFGAKHEIVFLLLKEKLTLALNNYLYRIVLHNQAATLTQILGDVFNETVTVESSADGDETIVNFSRQEENYIPMILVQHEKFT
ncbi:BTB/POZ domain-containing protein 2-like [Phlebotomus papatasi]|uniref:BTB/POZ domain-containing protein 2-like n=1 Tax=Phlebotomus papatasi TaxID=29031 RepID=UPI0024833266|nr:BTB/POZ domain-containing protein 2-like [Phlebotomus papatasi]